jgi:hypothetical protein
MIGALAMIGAACGSAAAYFADRLPRNRETIETCAGFLLIGGLALLGAALPVML